VRRRLPINKLIAFTNDKASPLDIFSISTPRGKTVLSLALGASGSTAALW
jgi:hypothetical protein